MQPDIALASDVVQHVPQGHLQPGTRSQYCVREDVGGGVAEGAGEREGDGGSGWLGKEEGGGTPKLSEAIACIHSVPAEHSGSVAADLMKCD